MKAAEPGAAREPAAIVGIGCLYPEAVGLEPFWRLMSSPAPPEPTGGSLDDLSVDLAGFRIPPVQHRSIPRMQALMLEAARQCVSDAGSFEPERVDVVVGTCFGLDRQYTNWLRVTGAEYAREVGRAAAVDEDGRMRHVSDSVAHHLRSALTERLGASTHDRVAEMASTIPARIAAAFGWHGRAIAVESADATAFVALEHAITSLRGRDCDAVLVVCGQRRESPVAEQILTMKGISPGPNGYRMAEGVTALLLKRRTTARRDGDRIYASLLECRTGHEPVPGELRYATTAHQRYRLAEQCHDAAAVRAAAVRYIDYVGPGIAAVTAADMRGIRLLWPDSVVLGASTARVGHTFANAGLAAVAGVALALHHNTVPVRPSHRGVPLPTPYDENGFTRAYSDAPHAAVCGSALGGLLSHALLACEPAAPPPRIERPRSSPTAAPEAIAVVGCGATFAGSADAPGFWRNVIAGQTSFAPLSDELLDRDLFYAPDAITLTHSYCEIGASMAPPLRPPTGADIAADRFRVLDPAQRVALRVAEESLSRYRGHPTLADRSGIVAIGSSLALANDRRLGAEYRLDTLSEQLEELAQWRRLPPAARERVRARLHLRNEPRPGAMSSAVADGCLASGVAGLIVGAYRLRAVPVAVEAACASTLAAVDHCVAALRQGRADYAIAGGVELPCNTKDLVLCSALGLLSPTTITPFDAAADGFTPGDGCALFVLKRLSDARRDADDILGVIRGIGGSNDAKSLIAPDIDGQVRAMRRAFAQVDFDPGSVDYLEAHGTGTRVGDRTELAAAARVYRTPQRTRALMIGSAKAFVGHTFAAAGAAGMLQALFALRTRTFPPNPRPSSPQPHSLSSDIPAHLPRVPTSWPAPVGHPRRAAVSSFGTGGINYHLLLEEYP